MASNVIFKVGTREQYLAIQQKDAHTLYWLEDTQELYKGDKLFGTGAIATAAMAGLMSAEDKEKLDALSAGGIAGLKPVDASVIIADGESGEKTIGVQLSKEEGNQIQLKGDGLFVSAPEAAKAPEYTIRKLDAATEGYASSYQLQKVTDGGTTPVGDVIDIPKDLMLQSGSVQTVTETDVPYAGAQIGDTYIDLVLNDPEASHIYIPTKGIIDTEALEDTFFTNGLTALPEGAAAGSILAAIGSYDALLEAVQADKVIVDLNESGGVYNRKVCIFANGGATAMNLVFMTGSDTFTIYQVQNVGDALALGVTNIQYARKSDVQDVSNLKAVVASMPDEILSEIVNVQRTETTNSAEIRIFTKQDDGTYSPAEKHGVLTLIPAGEGPDGVSGAGLMSLADKQKLDAIDVDEIAAMAESLTWGTM